LINISYSSDVDVASPFIFFFAFLSDLDRRLPFEDVCVSVEVLGSGSEFEDVGQFGCGESSEDFTFLVVAQARSSPYPVYHRGQQGKA
jgi:hypothetical protein